VSASEHISPDLQSAYLLGACTEGEARVAREHLTGCNACAHSLDQLRPAREALLEAAPVRSAPAYLKDAVMAEVRREAELFDAAKAPASTPAARPRLWERLRSPLPALGLAAAAALAVVVVVGVTGSAPGPLAPTVTVSDGEVDSRRAPGGNARLETEDGRVRLSVAGLPGPGPGRRYQVWLRTGERPPRSAQALFSVDAKGSASVVLPEGTGAADAVLVTSEPAGGSVLPSREPIVEVPT